MIPHEQFVRKVNHALDESAKQQPEQEQILAYVMDAVKSRPAARRRTIAMSGFALAAAIAGISLVPEFLTHQSNGQAGQPANTARLSPQMMEDMEMLSVLGMETKKYGS